MPHVRKGDMVIVTSGAYKGKRGKILRLVGDRVVVEKVAMIKRHQKPTQKTPQGAIIDKEQPIHLSNLALVDPKSGRPTRVRTRALSTGKKVRIAVASGEQIGKE